MRDVSFNGYSVVSYFKLTINDSYRPINFFPSRCLRWVSEEIARVAKRSCSNTSVTTSKCRRWRWHVASSFCTRLVIVHFFVFYRFTLITRGLNASFSNLAGNPGYYQVQPLVAEQFEGEFKQLKDAVNESKGTVVPVSKGWLAVW